MDDQSDCIVEQSTWVTAAQQIRRIKFVFGKVPLKLKWLEGLSGGGGIRWTEAGDIGCPPGGVTKKSRAGEKDLHLLVTYMSPQNATDGA